MNNRKNHTNASGKGHGNRRQGDFVVVARGVRRTSPDISAITRTSLDYYLASKEFEAQHTRGLDPTNKNPVRGLDELLGLNEPTEHLEDLDPFELNRPDEQESHHGAA